MFILDLFTFLQNVPNVMSQYVAVCQYILVIQCSLLDNFL